MTHTADISNKALSMKFIYKNSKDQNEHWKRCEKKHAPYIELNQLSSEYTNIFYDVTNLKVDLE